MPVKLVINRQKLRELAPGFLTCLLIALPCRWLGKALPVVGGPVFAILAGMLAALFYGEERRRSTQPGIAYTSKKILQLAVILLGGDHDRQPADAAYFGHLVSI